MTVTPTLPSSATVAPPAPGQPRLISGPPDLRSHLARLGRLPDHTGGLAEMVRRAGLTGRGGAGFPTAQKMAAVSRQRGQTAVVANGTEGEPLSAKDKTLLLRSPHLVLDGLDLAARALGARRRIICIERGRARVFDALRSALIERGDRKTEIVLTPSRYVSGQETALVDLVNGGPGRPVLARPFERGVDGQPTLVDNVETLAQLALIARFGPDWFRTVGTPTNPGTTLLTVAGAVTEPGVYEAPNGTRLTRLLQDAGASRPAGVLLGGYFGRWLPLSAVSNVTLDRHNLGALGATVGSGVIAVIDETSCAIAELARVAEWFAASSAGQCGACTWGLRDLAAAATALGRPGHDRPLHDLRRWTQMVKGRGACRLPDGAAGFLESGIETFSSEIADHLQGRCGREDRHHLRTPTPEPWS